MTWNASVLVVANATSTSDELLGAMRAKASKGPTHFTLVVPATAGARAQATERLDDAITGMREAGLQVSGRVADADPLVAFQESWDPRAFDEVVVSTLPGQTSKWLKIDLPHRIAQITGVQVTHVVAGAPQAERVPVPAPVKEKPGLGPLSVLTWGGR